MAATDRRRATCIIVNGPSSGGKSTLCAALQDALVELAGGEQGGSFASVAFDDFLRTLSTRYYPHSFTELTKGDTARLVSKVPHDGKAGWEYVDESEAEGHPGEAWSRLVFSPESERLLQGQCRGWGCHLELGTNLLVDAFLQEKSWADELLAVVKASGSRLLLVGVHCADAELERREQQRGDRPAGLARRSLVACHTHGLPYHIEVNTDHQPTEESVAAITTTLRALLIEEVEAR
jgi:chloramphenicol 3-O-phosphotransferase